MRRWQGLCIGREPAQQHRPDLLALGLSVAADPARGERACMGLHGPSDTIAPAQLASCADGTRFARSVRV